MPENVPPSDCGEAEEDGQDHGRAEHESEARKEITNVVRAGIEQGHPQTRKRCGKSAWDQEPPGGAVPAGPAAADAGDELEGAQRAVQADAEDVHHHGHGRREEPCVFRRDVRAAGQLGQAGCAGRDRNGAEREQRGGYEPPCPSGGGHGASPCRCSGHDSMVTIEVRRLIGA